MSECKHGPFSVFCPDCDLEQLREIDETSASPAGSVTFPLSHQACDAFWEYWKENGETHKHGYYEATWGAIRAYLEIAEKTDDQRAP